VPQHSEVWSTSTLCIDDNLVCFELSAGRIHEEHGFEDDLDDVRELVRQPSFSSTMPLLPWGMESTAPTEPQKRTPIMKDQEESFRLQMSDQSLAGI